MDDRGFSAQELIKFERDMADQKLLAKKRKSDPLILQGGTAKRDKKRERFISNQAYMKNVVFKEPQTGWVEINSENPPLSDEAFLKVSRDKEGMQDGRDA